MSNFLLTFEWRHVLFIIMKRINVLYTAQSSKSCLCYDPFEVASRDDDAGVKCSARLLQACWKHVIWCITVGNAGESQLAPELHSVLAYIVERGQVM